MAHAAVMDRVANLIEGAEGDSSFWGEKPRETVQATRAGEIELF